MLAGGKVSCADRSAASGKVAHSPQSSGTQTPMPRLAQMYECRCVCVCGYICERVANLFLSGFKLRTRIARRRFGLFTCWRHKAAGCKANEWAEQPAEWQRYIGCQRYAFTMNGRRQQQQQIFMSCLSAVKGAKPMCCTSLFDASCRLLWQLWPFTWPLRRIYAYVSKVYLAPEDDNRLQINCTKHTLTL